MLEVVGGVREEGGVEVWEGDTNVLYLIFLLLSRLSASSTPFDVGHVQEGAR